MKNLCKTCKWAKWDLCSVERPHCTKDPEYIIFAEGNYVDECPCYQANNVITCIINFVKGKK